MALAHIEGTCSQCGKVFSAQPSRSFLGFQKLRCPACQHVDTHPLTGGYRTAYWVIVVLMVLAIVNALASGNVAGPGLIGIAVIYALIKDGSLRRRARKAAQQVPPSAAA